MLLVSVVAEFEKMPPPVVEALLPDSALSFSERGPLTAAMAPPLVALLPASVALVSVRVPAPLKIPPPSADAVLPATVL
jgi:hypothetical protein